MGKLFNPQQPTDLPQATAEIVDQLLREGLRDEAAELTLAATDYIQTHDYYSVITGLGHLGIGVRDE